METARASLCRLEIGMRSWVSDVYPAFDPHDRFNFEVLSARPALGSAFFLSVIATYDSLLPGD
jgi:hypothetical protein